MNALREEMAPLSREFLEQTIKTAKKENMFLHAATAERRLGEMMGGDEGAALLAQGNGWMSTEGITDPDRITDVFAPGFE